MGLPLSWVDKIFSKLTLIYGRDFIGRWEGLEISDVKTDWAHELDGFDRFPEGIAFALQNMQPGKPPNVLEFRAMALKAPKPELVRLDAPKADPERIAAEFKKLDEVVKKPSAGGIDHKAWAKTILARHAAGERIRPISLRFANEALRTHLEVAQ